jgi:FkbM family methyltransferase
MSLLSKIFGARGGEDPRDTPPNMSAGSERVAAPEGEMPADERIRQGLAHHQAGDLHSAERAYRAVLEATPEEPLAHYLLGSLLGASGRLEAACEHLQTAARLDPSAAAPRSDLGNVFYSQGRVQEAEAAYRDAIAVEPEFADAHGNLGRLLLDAGRIDEAIESFSALASLVSDNPEAHFMLADALSAGGRYEAACSSYEAGLSLAPGVAAAHNNLGASLRHLSRAEEAMASFEAALRIDPELVDAHFNLADMLESRGAADKAIEHFRATVSRQTNDVRSRRRLGRLLLEQGRSDEALQVFRDVLTLEPDSARSHFELGNALSACGHRDEALERFDQAVRLDPNDASAHVNLGYALNDVKRFEEAAQCFREALERDPGLVEAHNNLGGVLQMQGQLRPAMQAYERALEIAPDALYIRSNYLTCLNYHEEALPENVYAEHRRWAELIEGTDAPKGAPAIPNLDPQRRLRIGYVSADLRYHSVAFFMAPIIEHHDRDKFEITCYANVAKPDANTRRLQELCDRWRDIASIDDAEVAAWIRRDEIDILVDLSGHTVGNRLPVFALRPAPVQVTYLGYPNTTGLSSMDYRLTDVMADPPGATEDLHSETLIRFEDGFLCFQPLESCPPIRERHGTGDGEGITFGSFNELLKVTPATVAAWCEILERVPGSSLVIKGTALGDEGTRQIVVNRFREHGIDAGRLRLVGRTQTLEEHLELYNGIDVALDTFPYNGTTTTCEALWMGVPVVTRSGHVHASRVGLSLLTRVGLGDLVAESVPEYVDKAVALAADAQRRSRLRGELRDRMRASPLMDGGVFTRRLESAYRDMWQSACAQSRDRADSGEVGGMSVDIAGGVRVRVPAKLDELTPYVLLEQEDWFEDEIRFVRHLVKPGMRCLDIGANYGIFSLTMAKRVAPGGRVWSFEPTPDTARYLSESLAENGLHNVTLAHMALSRTTGTAKLVTHDDSEHNYLTDNVANGDRFEMVDVKRLDEVASELDIGSIDFVKMDAEGAEIAILEGGEGFFASESPVLMFEIKNQEGMNWALLDALNARGYGVFRLVPGLQILVPFERDGFDSFLLNLFAIKPDRARLLEADGVAVACLSNDAVAERDDSNALEAVLGGRPYAQALWPKWREALCSDAAESARQRPNGLALYCRAWDPSLPMSDRYRALSAARVAMSQPREGRAEMARLFSLARITWELGYRQQAVDALKAICDLRDSGVGTPGAEPFLAVSDRFDAIEPGDAFESWCIVSVIEQRERLRAYSSYFAGDRMLGTLERLAQSPFACAEMERRRQLVRIREGLQKAPEPTLLVSRRSDENLNPDLWGCPDGARKPA